MSQVLAGNTKILLKVCQGLYIEPFCKFWLNWVRLSWFYNVSESDLAVCEGQFWQLLTADEISFDNFDDKFCLCLVFLKIWQS